MAVGRKTSKMLKPWGSARLIHRVFVRGEGLNG